MNVAKQAPKGKSWVVCEEIGWRQGDPRVVKKRAQE